MNATTEFRLLVLKITALVATLIAGGCNMPSSVTPQPGKPIEPQTVQLKITVDGEGKVSVGGGADVSVKSASNGSASAERCDCGCNQEGCRCSLCSAGVPGPAKATVDTFARSGPQLVTVTERVYQCRNGVCGWYDVPVQKLARSGASGRIKVYLQPNYLETNNASLAMRRAVGESAGIEWVYGQPPSVNGRALWPTAVKPDGSAWQSGDWGASSLDAFQDWLRK